MTWETCVVFFFQLEGQFHEDTIPLKFPGILMKLLRLINAINKSKSPDLYLREANDVSYRFWYQFFLSTEWIINVSCHLVMIGQNIFDTETAFVACLPYCRANTVCRKAKSFYFVLKRPVLDVLTFSGISVGNRVLVIFKRFLEDLVGCLGNQFVVDCLSVWLKV